MEIQEIRNELVKYSATDAAIAEMSKNYLALAIKGIEDQDGYKLVHTARMNVKAKRVAVKKRGEELREDANKFRTAVIDEVKRITALLEPIESHLEQEENRVDDEKERLKREVAEKEAKVLQDRVNGLFALGCRFDGEIYSYGDLKIPQALLKVCNDDQYAIFVGAITEAVEKEQIARAAEEAARKAENDRLTKVAAEQEAERRRLVAEARKIQEEKDRLFREAKAAENARIREEQEKIRAEELNKAMEKAAELARIATEERMKREIEEKAAKEKAAEEERIRKEEAARVKAERKLARLPDKEKLTVFLSELFSRTPDPSMMKTEEGKAASDSIAIIIQEAEKRCFVRIEQL
jgi:hypothetical protein